MRKLCVCYDSREHFPMIFGATFYYRPDDITTVFAVTVKRTRLKTADYFIDGHKRECLIERKASVSEIRANLFGAARKRWNFLQSLDRMCKESDNPYLFFDMTWKELCQDWDERGRSILRYPVGLYSHLLQELVVRGIGILGPIPARTVSQRRSAGSFLLDVMLTHIYPRRSLGADGVIQSSSTPAIPLRTTRQRGDRWKSMKFQKAQDQVNLLNARA